MARGSKQAENKPSTKLMKTFTIIFHSILFILNEVSKIRLNDDVVIIIVVYTTTLSVDRTEQQPKEISWEAILPVYRIFLSGTETDV